jgi:hypothetical protein
MDRRTFLNLGIASLFPARSSTANETKAKLQANPKQNILKLTYMPPFDTPGCILVRSPSNENIADIDIKSSTVENLPNDIQKIIKDLKQQYPDSSFIFEKSTMDYNRDEYDQLAETTLENLLKPSWKSRRELLALLARAS